MNYILNLIWRDWCHNQPFCLKMEKTSFLDVRLFASLEVKASHLLQTSAIKVRESRKPLSRESRFDLNPQAGNWNCQVVRLVACMIFLQIVFPSITGHSSLYDRSITNDSASFPDQGGQTHNLTVRGKASWIQNRWWQHDDNTGEEEPSDRREHQQGVCQAYPDGRAVHLHWEPVLPWLCLCLANGLRSKTLTFTQRPYLASSYHPTFVVFLFTFPLRCSAITRSRPRLLRRFPKWFLRGNSFAPTSSSPCILRVTRQLRQLRRYSPGRFVC